MSTNPKVARLLELTDAFRAKEARAADLRMQIAELQSMLADVESDLADAERALLSVASGVEDEDRSIPSLVRDYFRSHPTAQVGADTLIEAGIPASADHLRSTLNRMYRDEGFIVRVSRGVYTLAGGDQPTEAD